jgi:hypothetical protein
MMVLSLWIDETDEPAALAEWVSGVRRLTARAATPALPRRRAADRRERRVSAGDVEEPGLMLFSLL